MGKMMRDWLRARRHRLAHSLGWTTGQVETWWCPASRLMVGFRCTVCGRLGGIRPVPEHIVYPEQWSRP
jgi:hypothetical protein